MRSKSRDRTRRSPSEWRKILARFQRSGLGVDAFCERESVSKSSFVRWRAKLGSEIEPFIEVGVAASKTSDPSVWAVELELPSHIVLRVRG